MKQLLNIYKPLGITSTQLINKLREVHPEYKDCKIGFAGRLDPLAHGVLLLMIGEETKKRENYLHLDKTYEFEVVFGMQTDSYDVLGFLQQQKMHTIPEDLEEKVAQFLLHAKGKQRQKFPPFSSKPVQGKPLYWWAKNNKLSEITIPEKTIEIYEIKLLSFGIVESQIFKAKLEESIQLVDGYFRQEDTLEKWHDFFLKNANESFRTAKFVTRCSSGTYVRGLVTDLGSYLGCGAVTLEILRTQVGDYLLEKSTTI